MTLLLGAFPTEFDPAKDVTNQSKHGLSLAKSDEFDLSTSKIQISKNSLSHELRYVATGFIGSRLHVMVYCHNSDAIRVISLRKANNREIRKYYAK
ncbi:MAG: BrnT family toxin [Alphaproteobacteria bacterium]|nr:BrnT family toxin [Alphaproteobacteria bacterium]